MTNKIKKALFGSLSNILFGGNKPTQENNNANPLIPVAEPEEKEVEMIKKEEKIIQKPQMAQVPNFNNYILQKTNKRAIVLHGTFSGNAKGTIDWFSGGGQKGVSTHYIIGQDGKIYKLFNEDYFAYHCGKDFRKLSQQSIGIQIVNWLFLQKKDDNKYYTWTNKTLNGENVFESKLWRGYKYWQKLNKQQLESISNLVKHLCKQNKINVNNIAITKQDMGDVNSFNGVCFHSTFHPTKYDFVPELCNIIKQKIKNN